MLTIRKLKKTLGGCTLFEHADLQINYGERVALVGPNGAGKSTIFGLILKKDEPDAGVIERDEWTMIGHLAQEGEAIGDETVMDVATGRAGEIPALELLAPLGNPHPPGPRCCLGRYQPDDSRVSVSGSPRWVRSRAWW